MEAAAKMPFGLRAQSAIWSFACVTLAACASAGAPAATSSGGGTRQILVNNASSARIEIYLVPADGPGQRVGNIAAGGKLDVSFISTRYRPSIAAYQGTDVMTRIPVRCTVPAEVDGKLSVTCGP